MISVGIDIIEIKRIETAMKRHKSFLKRNFTDKEIKYFLSKEKNIAQTVAGNFAAKEAFSKALGTGVRNFSLQDIEILRNKFGEPVLFFKNKKKKCKISISHSKNDAISIVILHKSFFKNAFSCILYKMSNW